MSKTLVIRADANVAMGTGHAMRCVALAQSWQDSGGNCIFAMADSTRSIQERIRAEGFDIWEVPVEAGSLADARETVKLSIGCGAEWVVVDGYQFGSEYQQALKGESLSLLFIDDNGHALRYMADAVLNQNAHASAALYPDRDPHTKLLLGPQYALLRREFGAWRKWQRGIEATGNKILVTMGGSDPENVTETVIRALSLLPIESLQVKVVVGGTNPHYGSLDRAASSNRPRFQLLNGTGDMPELMAWADLAISAAGSTCWEICLLSLPAIIIPVAENQRASTDRLNVIGAAKSISNPDSILSTLPDLATRLLLSGHERAKMSSVARSLVDGEGAARVVGSMLKPIAQMAGRN